ncbi:lysM and putative peptidoglycan-binding domain-containing protein 3 isoform X2 [Leguminivora glycinivorella]|uniref:lysM and putative peptidoglycan-binding domain-containing protein 3 isoform X2 n=1 Tax=Leguminivora glycinivorella TaxID=1035111 RepID=UPI00200BFBD0|nr:lysM and putative peptidoglycan-binding domain-containing protein 3 isoform X2 [Leguminivora glycinivorella]
MKQRTRLMHGDEFTGYNMSVKKDDGQDNSEIPLHKMKSQDHFIEAQVQDGDTLQAIALRFHCSIAELKRINHIHKDNEIFARRTVKVPVTPYSVLTEIMSPPLDAVPSTSKEINGNTDFAIDCNAIVMNSTLAPAVIPYTDAEPTEPITEDTQLLPNKLRETVETVVVKELTSHGADFGLKWYHLLCCVLILGVVIPLVYVLFYLDKHEIVEIVESSTKAVLTNTSDDDLPPGHSQ